MSDGCGNTCACGVGASCAADNVCVDNAACTDTCASAGAVCGVVCGEVCGSCNEGELCEGGTCATDPNCVGSCPVGQCNVTDGCGLQCVCGQGETCNANNVNVSIRVRVLTPVHLRGRFVATFVVKTAALVRTMNLANLGNVSVYPHAQMMGRVAWTISAVVPVAAAMVCCVLSKVFATTPRRVTIPVKAKVKNAVRFVGLIVGVVALERLVPPEPAFKSLQT